MLKSSSGQRSTQRAGFPRRRRGALAAVLLALSSTVTAAAAAPGATGTPGRPVVATDHGLVRGRAHDGFATYEGIPFAVPPTGGLRWRPPKPARPWRGVREAGEPGPQCLQPPALGGGPPTGSEDCLHLNVTTPTGPGPLRGRPVMVWLHGGGFTFGTGSIYHPERLAVRGGAVVVTVNYRLGTLGFFGHPELKNAPPFGLADQQAALRWVRSNAARFGGDPGNVTLFGVSAGGLSTCAQLVSPTAAGLFDKAVLQSGSCMTAYPPGALIPSLPAYRPFVSQRSLRDAGAAAAARLGCPQGGAGTGASTGTGSGTGTATGTGTGALDCLRGLSAEKLVTPELTAVFNGPAYGNPLLPMEPARALEAGRFHRMPVMQGANRDEMRMFLGFTLGQYPLRGARDYRARLRNSFGAAAGSVEAEYPLSAYPTPALAWAAVTTDNAWACTTLHADRALSRRVPTYAYEFADRTAPVLEGLPDVLGFPYGAAHGFELPYLFVSPLTKQPLTDRQRALANRMVDYWTRFARTGNPNHPGAPAWPAFRSDRTPLAQSLAPGRHGVEPFDVGQAHHCSFWERHRG
ncbi:carboxylesterase/lipase family protein [Streptomyces telluris]|uniref:Carboxylic ester hydrolase n=1 Tax=Streptomyces telluris TaxID=2720021 RepID=A0A9X2LHK1_9ACTN|nr:carboxylesterase family protein [Streptomyces telluris]MCQ8771308.1 carboxylesterase family protein [Streptomyces telluris]